MGECALPKIKECHPEGMSIGAGTVEDLGVITKLAKMLPA